MQLRGLFLSEQGVRVHRAEWGLRVWYRLTREASLHYCHGLAICYLFDMGYSTKAAVSLDQQGQNGLRHDQESSSARRTHI